MYAFDVIGELYFGSMFGVLETREVVGGYIDVLDRRMPAF